MTTSSAALAAALVLSTHALPTFPCLSTKAPACPRGFKAATDDPASIRHLWYHFPGPLVGVPTGGASGLAVLDIDTEQGVLPGWWAANKHRLPDTRRHQTPSGGFHLLFQNMPGLRCSVGRIAPGIDVRAEGGYVLWWPATGLPVLSDAQPAAWPAWLSDAVRPAPCPAAAIVPEGPGCHTRYAAAALSSAARNVSLATVGTRNDTLNRETYSLLRLPGLSSHTIAVCMAKAAQAAGLPDAEIVATLNSVFSARRGVR